MTTWLTQAEAAEYLRMAPGTFNNYVSKGFFPYYRHPQAGTKRFRAADLDSVMERFPAQLPEQENGKKQVMRQEK